MCRQEVNVPSPHGLLELPEANEHSVKRGDMVRCV